MSMRTSLYAISSLEPIRQAIASRDQNLVDALVQLNNRDDEGDADPELLEEELESREEFREQAEGMILCETPPAKEPGSWCYLIYHLATHFGLELERLALDDWKHHYCWKPYRKLLTSLTSPAAIAYLGYLENGRALRGTTIEDDGCLFAWLSADETKELSRSLKAVPREKITNDELQDFHEELVESLNDAASRDAELFFAAS